MADLPEDVKRQALEAAREAKVAMRMDTMPGRDAGLPDVERGPTTLPGQIPAYGRNLNPAESVPEPQRTIEPER